METVRKRVPDNLIDPYQRPAQIVVPQGATETDEEDGRISHGVDIDWPIKGDRQPWVLVESVEQIEKRDVLAV
jgi:hypothetical protein